MTKRVTAQALGTALVVSLIGASGTARATEGYFQTGYGTVQKAQAGAGVANPEDAMSLSVNPAGLVDVGNQINAAFTLFSPRRDVAVTGPGFLSTGKTRSDSDYFLMPNAAYSRQIDGQSAWGVAVFGNGGMNTNWPTGSGNGIFQGGRAGVNLEQLFLTVGYAHRFGDVSVGVAPVVALQKFRAEGLGAFAGFSADPAHLTNQGDDYAYGGGVRAGIEWKIRPDLRFGLTGQTPIWSTKFTKYAGLFADGGSFDIPGSVSAGFAWDASSSVTLLADYRHVFYGSVSAIGNSSLKFLAGVPFGGAGGSGFGWHDVDVVSLAASWKATTDLTLRAGWSHNTNPVRAEDVMLNILAPGVVTDHFAAGLSYKVDAHSGIDLAFGYVPRVHVTGVTPLAFGGQIVDISMEQYEASIGYSYKF